MIIGQLAERAEDSPNDAFLLSKGQRLGFKESKRLVDTIVVGLDRNSGPGEVVAVQLSDEIRIALTVLACMQTGRPFVVLAPGAPAQRIAYYLADSGAGLLVRDEGGPLPSEADSAPLSEVAWADLLRSGDGATGGRTVVGTDPACLIYTSGSTGDPKAVVPTYDNIAFSTAAIQSSLRHSSEDVILTGLPLSFDFGLYQIFLALVSGCSVYFAKPLEMGPGLAGVLARSAATVLPLVPPSAEKVAVAMDKGLRLGGVRLITTTGAALSPATAGRIREHSPGVDVRAMYGLTECKRVAIMPEGAWSAKPGSCGVPLAGTRVTVRDEGDAALPPGEIGEICVEGPHLTSGYWRRPDLSATRFTRADAVRTMLRTGDYGYLDEDGFLYVSGRRDDIFKHKGFRVSVLEVEEAAMRDCGVDSACATPESEETAFALVYTGAADPDRLRLFLTEQIEEHKIPRRLLRVDVLPRTANGKIDRKAVAQQWWTRKKS